MKSIDKTNKKLFVQSKHLKFIQDSKNLNSTTITNAITEIVFLSIVDFLCLSLFWKWKKMFIKTQLNAQIDEVLINNNVFYCFKNCKRKQCPITFKTTTNISWKIKRQKE